MRYLFILLFFTCQYAFAQDGDNINTELGYAFGFSMPYSSGVYSQEEPIFRIAADINVDGRNKPVYFSGGLRVGGDWAASTGPSFNLVGGICYAIPLAKRHVVRFNVLVGPVFEFETYTHLIGLRTNITSEANVNFFIDKRMSVGLKYYRPLIPYSGDYDFTVNALMFCMMFRLN
jgi:hypothetical protein